MSAPIRGQEVTIRVTVDGQTQQGSFFKVKDFTVTPRQELIEREYLGESETDLDVQHSGYDVSFSVDMLDHRTIDYLTSAVDRELNHQRPKSIVMTVMYAFREADADGRIEVYRQGVMKIRETGFSGRKEAVSVGFDAKFKKRDVIQQ